MHELETYTAPDVVKIVVGNKVDKVRPLLSTTFYIKPVRLTRVPRRSFLDLQEFSRQVTTSEGKAFADHIGCLFVGAYLCSTNVILPAVAQQSLNFLIPNNRGVRQDAHRCEGGL